MSTIEPTILLIIRLASLAWDVPIDLIAAIIDAESSWNINALGDHNDKREPESFGLMQVNIHGAGHGYPVDLLLNPAFNVFLGTYYFKHCMEMHPMNIKLAISSYNQGAAGAARRGYEHNKVYVENVLNLRHKYFEELKK